MHSVKIAMHKIARRDFQSAHIHRTPEVDDMGIGVRHCNVRSKQLKAGLVDVGDITHTSVGHQRNTPQSLQNLRVDRTNERP